MDAKEDAQIAAMQQTIANVEHHGEQIIAEEENKAKENEKFMVKPEKETKTEETKPTADENEEDPSLPLVVTAGVLVVVNLILIGAIVLMYRRVQAIKEKQEQSEINDKLQYIYNHANKNIDLSALDGSGGQSRLPRVGGNNDETNPLKGEEEMVSLRRPVRHSRAVINENGDAVLVFSHDEDGKSTTKRSNSRDIVWFILSQYPQGKRLFSSKVFSRERGRT